MIDLEAIKGRLAATSWGEWWLHLSNPRIVCGKTLCEMEIRYGDPKDDGDSFDLLDGYSEDDYRFIAHSKKDTGDLINELESLRSQLAAATERAERLDRELTAAIEAGAKIVGLSAAAAGYSTTNSEDEAKFMAMAGLEQTS